MGRCEFPRIENEQPLEVFGDSLRVQGYARPLWRSGRLTPPVNLLAHMCGLLRGKKGATDRRKREADCIEDFLLEMIRQRCRGRVFNVLNLFIRPVETYREPMFATREKRHQVWPFFALCQQEGVSR